jgi:hypothetical protein
VRMQPVCKRSSASKQASDEAHRQTLEDILVYSIPFLYYITITYSFCQAKHTQAGEEQDEKDLRAQIQNCNKPRCR